MSEYTRLARKANRIQRMVESRVGRAVLGRDARARVMGMFGAELTEAGAKVRGDYFLVIAASGDGSEMGVYLEGNKYPAIVSHVVYPPLELGEEEPALYAGAEDAAVHFLTGASPYPAPGIPEEGYPGARAA